jgi:hypothetical protein
MKPRLSASALFFISAYAPLSLIFIVSDFDGKTRSFPHVVPLATLLGICVLSVVVLLVSVRQMQGQYSVTVEAVSNRSGELLNYAIPYIVSFAGVDVTQVKSAVSFGILMVLLFLLTWRTQTIMINPILAICGYGFYEVSFNDGTARRTGIFISDSELQPGSTYCMERMTNYLFIVNKKRGAK